MHFLNPVVGVHTYVHHSTGMYLITLSPVLPEVIVLFFICSISIVIYLVTLSPILILFSLFLFAAYGCDYQVHATIIHCKVINQSKQLIAGYSIILTDSVIMWWHFRHLLQSHVQQVLCSCVKVESCANYFKYLSAKP